MAQSLGELFVKLGFDVDDAKLKSFDNSIKSTFSEIMKLAGVSLTIAGFTVIAKDASDAALQVRNLGTDFNTSAKSAQGFAAALHQFNPLVSTAQGLQSYKGLEKYVQNIRTTGGSATAYNMLGGFFDDNTNADVIIKTVQKNLPGIIKERGAEFASKWVNDLFGDVGAMNALTKSLEDFQKAAEKGIASQETIDKTVQMRENVSALINSWDLFWLNIVGKISPYIASPLQAVNEKGWRGAIGDFIGGQSERARIRHIIGWNASPEEVDAYIAKSKGGGSPAAAGSISSLLQNSGWTAEQSAGIIKRLMIESGLNPAAVGDGGKAYGIAQWHPDRQANFARWAGKDIHGSSVEEQVAFMNYELTQGLERKAGDRLRQTGSAQDAYNSFTKDYERPSVTQTNNIVVHTTADAKETAEEINRRIADHFSHAYAQTNLGGSY